MRTASWATYSGPGRIALSPAPPDVPLGYRHAPTGIRLRRPASHAEIRARLAVLDARAVWVALHEMTYPHEPVLMGDRLDPFYSYRRTLAAWLWSNTGYPIPELDAAKYRPQRAHPSVWRPFAKRLQYSMSIGVVPQDLTKNDA